MNREQLCCPKCGTTALHSDEVASIMYDVGLFRATTGVVEVEYGGSDHLVMDEGTQYCGDIWCRDCGSQLNESQLVTLRTFTHTATDPITIEEESHGGRDPSWQAVCWAARDDWSCDWCSRWVHADEWVMSIPLNDDPAETNPSARAYEHARLLGEEHLAEFIGDTDRVANITDPGASDGAEDDAQARTRAEGAAPSRT